MLDWTDSFSLGIETEARRFITDTRLPGVNACADIPEQHVVIWGEHFKFGRRTMQLVQAFLGRVLAASQSSSSTPITGWSLPPA